ncbi:hypothetical protein HY479_00345 [Candidatus Uhrbacteria bacterium]|nr:hypothetical protein [Candidatus Uhrbacteria bacterium]
MFHIEDVLQLKEREDVKLLVRRHPVTLVPGLGFAMLLIVIPFFFLFPLFSFGLPGMGVFLVSVLAGIVVTVRTFILWDSDVLIITTLRLVDVDQKGVFSRFVTEVSFLSVKDVSWKRHGFVDTACGVGTLTVSRSGESKPLEITRVSHPERVQETINDARHATVKHPDPPSDRQERLRKLMADLETLPTDALERIERLARGESHEPPTGLVVQKKTIE